MKKRVLAVACLNLVMFFEKNIRSCEHIVVDPIVDLRAPRSLLEELHSGINDVYVSLESVLENHLNLVTVAQAVQTDLNELCNKYDMMVGTTRNHQVYRDDKEFLQKMIDRINSMIDALENNHDENEALDQEEQDALRSVKAVCDSFHAKISF